MEINRLPEVERQIFNEIREKFGKGREGVHLTDLLTPRKKFWGTVAPLPPTDDEIMYWLTGKGHENVFIRVSGYEHLAVGEWKGLKYTPDTFHRKVAKIETSDSGGFQRVVGEEDLSGPVEIKTRRAAPAEPGKEAERYDHYLAQLVGYCAIKGSKRGYLFVWCLTSPDKNAGWKSTKPEMFVYEVLFTEEELMAERMRLGQVQVALLESLHKISEIRDTDGRKLHPKGAHLKLPLCPSWMCGKEVAKIIRKPYCGTCDKEFATISGGAKHTESKVGKGHRVAPAEFERKYAAKCPYFVECRGHEEWVPKDIITEQEATNEQGTTGEGGEGGNEEGTGDAV